MIRTLEQDAEGYDLCIVGSGPAGLTIAAELARTRLRLCVLESGAEGKSAFAYGLKKVLSRGLPVKPESRERIFGGSGTVWGGLSAPLDPLDFESRPWSEGWTVAREELERYWREAQRYGFSAPEEFKNTGAFWKFGTLQEKLFVAVRPPYNFARLRPIFERDGADLFLRATVTGFVPSAEGSTPRVIEAVCKTEAGDTVRVRAQRFVLAAGGIENARLLLVSGLGNEHDQVGRYFMNHPKGYAGRLRLRAPLPATSPYLPRSAGGRMMYAGLTLSESKRREGGLLSSYVQFEPDSKILARYALALWRRLPAFASPLFNILRPRTLRMRWYADMEPQAENCVVLSGEKDTYGTPLPEVSYSLGPRDVETLRTLHAHLQEEVKTLGIGRLEGTADEVIASVYDDASHHLGATRMGTDPRTSVVDSDGKVHTVSNVYVAGGSVFPTGGSANPTYTIVALAMRLAKHLERVSSGTIG